MESFKDTSFVPTSKKMPKHEAESASQCLRKKHTKQKKKLVISYSQKPNLYQKKKHKWASLTSLPGKQEDEYKETFLISYQKSSSRR